MDYPIREMKLADYNSVLELWTQTEHMSLNECDTLERIAFYLARNPGLCFVASWQGQIAGAILCGHDGRRGILRHLAVAQNHRGAGLGQKLVARSVEGLASQGIEKCYVMVLNANESGAAFWARHGWHDTRDDFQTMQKVTQALASRS